MLLAEEETSPLLSGSTLLLTKRHEIAIFSHVRTRPLSRVFVFLGYDPSADG